MFTPRTEISAFTSHQKLERTLHSRWQTTTSLLPNTRREFLPRKVFSWLPWSVIWGTLSSFTSLFWVLKLCPSSNQTFKSLFMFIISFTGQKILTWDVPGTKEAKTLRPHCEQESAKDPGNTGLTLRLLFYIVDIRAHVVH